MQTLLPSQTFSASVSKEYVIVDADECGFNNGGCSMNATCTNIPGSRMCTCNPGYTGDGLTCEVPPARLIINEILANEPGSATSGEFVELVNVGGSALDISGWTVSDATAVRHTFAAGTVLAPGKAVVVFGGASSIPSGLSNAVAASTGTLNLANTSDSVTVKDTAGISVDSFSYTSSLASADGVSMNRNPDATVGAGFALHNTVSTLTASAGKRANGTAF
ncbi:lamin tail domain-containing protein [Vitiosangium sp. GDMCC 1.1324]|uniref:lamin tail domain-containing protein n=1 Tax=Vitiosangium sp. (strain GDMCC 1.1324) TaxID=2138576 RepID=UPI001E2FBFA7|nr:lamin tail domain-containing protein [Vitiosangium sp. GDMCC 1.1324]